MSRATVIACDGCNETAAQHGKRPIYPAGWLRLAVHGRATEATQSMQLGTVDVCTPACAPKALEEYKKRVMTGDRMEP